MLHFDYTLHVRISDSPEAPAKQLEQGSNAGLVTYREDKQK
jgi:hypothetical protein